MVNTEILFEREVNNDKLLELFNRAFINASLDKDNDVMLEIDNFIMFVSINEGNKLIKFLCLLALKPEFTLEQKHAFVNNMNDGVVFARFSISDQNENTLISTYYLPYEQGVVAYSVINAARKLLRITSATIREFDTLDMIN